MPQTYLENLLSGLIGALIATALSVWYQSFSEQIKNRADVMMAVIEWVNNIYVKLQSLEINKHLIYTKQKPSLSSEEHRALNDEVRILLLSDKMGTHVARVYGEGDVLQKMNALQGELIKITEILWAAKEENWLDSHKAINKAFEQKIDPIKEGLMRDFLTSVREISNVNKIIAREGLILFCFLLFLTASNSLLSYPSFKGSAYLAITLFSLSSIGYPAYLSSRFVFWATNTLRKN